MEPNRLKLGLGHCQATGFSEQNKLSCGGGVKVIGFEKCKMPWNAAVNCSAAIGRRKRRSVIQKLMTFGAMRVRDGVDSAILSAWSFLIKVQARITFYQSPLLYSTNVLKVFEAFLASICSFEDYMRVPPPPSLLSTALIPFCYFPRHPPTTGFVAYCHSSLVLSSSSSLLLVSLSPFYPFLPFNLISIFSLCYIPFLIFFGSISCVALLNTSLPFPFFVLRSPIF